MHRPPTTRDRSTTRPTNTTPLLTVVLIIASGCAPEIDTPPESSALQAVPEIGASAPVGAILDTPDPIVQPIEVGDGWRRVRVQGDVDDGETGAKKALDAEYYVFDGRAAIRSALLPEKTRQALIQSTEREAAPQDPEDDELIIVPKAISDKIEAPVVKGQAFSQAFSLCDDDEEKTYSKSYSFDKHYPYHKGDETGSFQGSADFDARLKGAITGTVKYTVKRDWYTACIPYAVIRRVTLAGNADVLATANVDAEFKKTWHYEKEIAAPKLGTVTLPVVPIPITFRAPITIGLDAAAQAELHANAQYQAHGAFNIICRKSGCTGSKSATHSFTPGGSPSLGATGKVKVTPFVEGAIRAYIVDEWLASAQVGVRAGLPAELFGYFGNTCGDANHDGTNEWVSAATLDLNVNIDVVAKARFLGDYKGPWSWNVWNRHLAFWSFGSGSVLDPIFYDEPGGATAATMRGKMRPCWPYDDNITYRITWNDGTTSLFTGNPDTLFSKSHEYGSWGTKIVTLEALSDAKGRSIGGSTTDSVKLSPFSLPTLPVISLN
jgi:hypothetical protein